MPEPTRPYYRGGLRHWLLLCMIWLLMGVAQSAPRIGGASGNGGDPQFVTRPPTPQATRDNLFLSSTLIPGSAPYPGTLFTVLREEPAAFGKTRLKVLASSGPHAQASFHLAPGRYLVRASNGAVTRERLVDLLPNRVLHEAIELDAGELHLSSVMSARGEPAEQTWFKVFRVEPDAYGRPQRVQVAGNGYTDEFAFLLPAGEYIAEAVFGHSRVEKTIRLAPGLVQHQRFNLEAGSLTVSATFGADGEPLPSEFSILRSPPDRGMPRQVAQASGTGPITFVLPQGDYLVRAESGDVGREQSVGLAAGEEQSVELSLAAGDLTLVATLADSQNILANTHFQVIPLAGDTAGSALDYGHNRQLTVRLPEGRYRVIARNGETRGNMEIEVVAGESQEVSVPVEAGRVSLHLQNAPGATPLSHSQFSIYRVEPHGKGLRRTRILNSGYTDQVTALLPPGNYIAFARTARLKGEQSFSLLAGDNRNIAIVAHR